MKVLVISGFLGAGKTTFLKHLAGRTHRDFAVMENEYGQVPVDGERLSQDTEKLNIWELTEGCICCSRKSDFAASVLTIANTLDPEYLIVEPTGVGMLSSILRQLQQIQYEKIRLLSPVTIVDGRAFRRNLRDYPEIMKDQLRHAGTVLVSKMESGEVPEELEEALRVLAPQAELCLEPYRAMPGEFFLSLLRRDPAGREIREEAAGEAPESLGLTQISLSSPDRLLLFLNGIVSGVFGDICRSKGCLKAGDGYLRFDTAGTAYRITGCDQPTESRAVFIGRALQRSQLRQILQQELTMTAPPLFRRTPR